MIYNVNLGKLNTFLIKSFIVVLFVGLIYIPKLCFAGSGELPDYVSKVENSNRNPEYKVLLNSDQALRSGVESNIDIAISYGALYGRNKKEGESIKNLQVVYDRIVEVFVTSEDFGYFDHVRPEDFGEVTPEIMASSTFSVKQTFPHGGMYRFVVCFSHKGQTIYKHFNVKVEGDGPSASDETKVVGDNPKLGVFSGYNVALKIEPFPPVPNRKTNFVFNLQDENGKAVDDLDVFMGTEMHFVTWRKDFQTFGYERTKPEKGKPGTVMIVPPIQTDMRYGTGILREILDDGKMIVEHGKVKGLLPAGKFTFKVTDPKAGIKVEVGDWVEFWVVNRPETGIAITRIEPLATVPTGDEEGVYEWAGNIPIYPGPVVPIEHKFLLPGDYVLFAQFFHKGKIVTTKFEFEVKNVGANHYVEKNVDSDEDKGLVKLSPQELDGQLIYRESRSLSGKPIFIKQDDGSTIDAVTTGITCLGCHGEDGRGGQEGGVLSSDIRYEYLTKPYGVSHPSGRKHPAYSDDLLKKVISHGIDPANNKLDPTMVRWEMDDSSLNNLVAYIHKLSEMGKPGVTDRVIRVGCVLDISGPLATTGMAVKEMIEESFNEINNNGKIYGRKLKLVVADGGNDMAKSLEAAKWLVEKENIFCFLANLGEAAMKEVVPYLEKNGVPLVVPLAPTYQPDSMLSAKSFYLFPSIDYQVRVLVDYIMRSRFNKGVKPKITALYSDDVYGQNGLKAAKDQLTIYGGGEIEEIVYDYKALDFAKIAALLAEKAADNVLIITPDVRVISVIAEADRLGYSPKYYCNNMLVMKDILNIPKASERFLIVQNFSFDGKDNPNCAEFLKIIKNIPSRPRNIMLQMASFVGVKVLEEGLRLTGRDLTRESLAIGLEKLELNSGLFGVITFKSGKHEGLSGVYLVRPDASVKNFIPVTRWLKPTEKGNMF